VENPPLCSNTSYLSNRSEAFATSTYFACMRPGLALQEIPDNPTRNASAAVTKMAPALPRPSLPAKQMTSLPESQPSMGYMTTRGYSDSAVPGCRATAVKERGDYGHLGLSQTGLVEVVSESGLTLTQSIHVKSRPNFQLPCFRTLGISSRFPHALLTPPDEAIVEFKPAIPPGLIPRSSSYPPINIPKTPSPECNDLAAILGRDPSANAASSTAPPAIVATETLDTVEEEGAGPMSSSSEDEDVGPARGGWIVDAVEVAGKLNLCLENTTNPYANITSCKH